MLNQLKKIFPSLICTKSKNREPDSHFIWFMTPEAQMIGIHQDELTQKDIAILSTFFEPYHLLFPVKSVKEQNWLATIHRPKASSQKTKTPYRFIYFNIIAKQIDPKAFKEAINELFPQEVAILWENEQEGIIIEEQIRSEEDIISYEQIIDILMSDLYVKLHFLVGPFQHHLAMVNFYYHHVLNGGQITFNYSDKNVVHLMEAIPFILMEETTPTFKNFFTDNILKEFATDQELQKTLEVFFQCNLNVSVAAKKLYMHRNSLQYRLERFKKQTGIDVRDFHQALIVYLALIANQSLS